MSVSLKQKNSKVEDLLESASLLVEVTQNGADPEDTKTIGLIALSDFSEFAKDQQAFSQYPELSAYAGMDLLDKRIVGMSKNILALITEGTITTNEEEVSQVVPFAQNIVDSYEEVQTKKQAKKSRTILAREIHDTDQRASEEREEFDPVAVAKATKKSFTPEGALRAVNKTGTQSTTAHDTLNKHTEPKFIRELIGQFRAYTRLQNGGNFDSQNTKNEAIIGIKNTFMFFLENSSKKNPSKMDSMVGRVFSVLKDSEKKDYEVLVNGLVAEYITADILRDLKAKGRINDYHPTDDGTDANEGTDFFVDVDLADEITGRPVSTEIRIDAKSIGGFIEGHSKGRDIGTEEEFFDIAPNRQGNPVIIFCPDRSKKRPLLKSHSLNKFIKRFDSYSSNKSYKHMLSSVGSQLVEFIVDNGNLLSRR